jgi:hypothetical protein
MILLLSGCRTPKKTAGTTIENVTVQEKQNQTGKNETYTFVDTTEKSGFEISYFKVEFYPPDTVRQNQATVPENDSNTDVKKPPNQGAIKSVEKITVKANEEKAGITSIADNSTAETNTEYNAKMDTTAETVEQPAADPFRWRYIFGTAVAIVLLAAGAYFMLRKNKVVTTVFTFLRKIF